MDCSARADSGAAGSASGGSTGPLTGQVKFVGSGGSFVVRGNIFSKRLEVSNLSIMLKYYDIS